MARIIALLLAVFAAIPCLAQNHAPKQLYQNIKTNKPDSTQIAALLKLADYHLKESNKVSRPRSLDSAYFYTKRAEKKSTSSKNGLAKSYILYSKIALRKQQFGQAEAWANKAIAQLGDKNPLLGEAYIAQLLSRADERNPAESVAIAEKAEKIFKEAGDTKNQAVAVAKIAEFTANTGKINPGIELFKKSIALNESAGKQDNQFLESWICILYDAQGQYKPAMEHALKAVRLAEKFNENDQEAVQVNFYAGVVHGHVEDKDKEMYYLRKALEISRNYTDYSTTNQIEAILFRNYMLAKDRNAALNVLKGMEQTFAKLSPSGQIYNIGTLIRSYTSLNEYKKAEPYANKSMALSDKMAPDDDRQEPLYNGLTGYLYRTGQYGLARKYAKNYLKYNERFKNPIVEKDMQHMLFRIDSAQGNFDAALANYKRENEIKNSLLDTEKNREIAELQVKYQTEKKDSDLLLLKKQSELQQSKLSKSNLMRNIAFASVGVFAVILVLLYNRYRIKQKTNRMLDSQKNEIDQKNSALEKLVTEKEWLVREIHHRVKNNLQMVISLLNAQSHYLKDETAMAAIKESQDRIYSMSLIHKKLYQTENVVSINMCVYIGELVQYFRQSYNTGQRIVFDIDAENIELDAVQAVPTGLILNEAITNSLKHGFDENQQGLIAIALKRISSGRLKLSIKDNGKGIPDYRPDIDYQSLGMKLIKGLSADLDADLNIVSENGLAIIIEFDYLQKTADSSLSKTA
ncbi:histidine kinase dimerization/phosphoacceptor domain -containing protein [Flavobacterium sp.]|uniref:tetratricopeptide repeat-containing sensor histidine kinase n=1 Tax=Flavobacterium sp. TaxID=239 RepID=UPI0039E6F133